MRRRRRLKSKAKSKAVLGEGEAEDGWLVVGGGGWLLVEDVFENLMKS